MLYAFLAILAILVSGITLICVESKKDCYDQNDFLIGLGVVSIILTTICMIIFAINCVDYVACGYKAEIINKEYGTHYTQAEVFYGSDVIETIQQVKRQRIEINGNLLKDDGNK